LWESNEDLLHYLHKWIEDVGRTNRKRKKRSGVGPPSKGQQQLPLPSQANATARHGTTRHHNTTLPCSSRELLLFAKNTFVHSILPDMMVSDAVAFAKVGISSLALGRHYFQPFENRVTLCKLLLLVQRLKDRSPSHRLGSVIVSGVDGRSTWPSGRVLNDDVVELLEAPLPTTTTSERVMVREVAGAFVLGLLCWGD
jgi:hypothetical protein